MESLQSFVSTSCLSYDTKQLMQTFINIVNALFIFFLVLAQLFDIYINILPDISLLFQAIWNYLRPRVFRWISWSILMYRLMLRLPKILQDFNSGYYYNPVSSKKHVIIRSSDAMQELSEASELSQRAVYSDIFAFQYTLAHSKIDLDPNEQTNLRYRLFSRAIRINGGAQMKALEPYLRARLQRTLVEEIDPQLTSEGWKSIKIAPVMRRLATGMLGIYFFGEKLALWFRQLLSESVLAGNAGESDFSLAMSHYYNDTITCMGTLPMVPTFMKPLVYSIITRKGRALNILLTRMLSTADANFGSWEEKEPLRSMTLLYNMIEGSQGSKYWTNLAVLQALIGIWFAASHQPWINLHFALLELCARPEYVGLIRQEIQQQETLDYDSINKLQILDSFIKESMRLNPLDKMAIRRKALRPYKFSRGGPQVAVGEIACVSAWEIMHNESKYPNPNIFDGLRFVQGGTASVPGQPGSELRGTKLTDASVDFPVWGLGSKVCVGRWHSSLILKMILAHLIVNYDFCLKDTSTSHRWFWETFQMPYESSEVLFRKRQQQNAGEG